MLNERSSAISKIGRAARIFSAAVVAMISLHAHAEFPEHPLRVIVPFAPGGTTDTLSRMLGEKLSVKLGQPVIVENRAGGSEQIAFNALKGAQPDGYTIMVSTMGGLTINPSLYGSKLSYNPEKDAVPILLAASLPSIFFVHPSLPVKTLDQLTEYVRANPGKISYASSGAGQPAHLAMELYKSMTRTDLNHVPYKGGAPALQDLAAGHVMVMAAIGAEGMPFAKAGKMNALAVTTLERSPLFPQLPAASEFKDLKGFDMPQWFAYIAPARTPSIIIGKLNRAFNEVLEDRAIRAKMTELGMEPVGGTPRQLAEKMKSDSARWAKLIGDAGIKLD